MTHSDTHHKLLSLWGRTNYLTTVSGDDKRILLGIIRHSVTWCVRRDDYWSVQYRRLLILLTCFLVAPWEVNNYFYCTHFNCCKCINFNFSVHLLNYLSLLLKFVLFLHVYFQWKMYNKKTASGHLCFVTIFIVREKIIMNIIQNRIIKCGIKEIMYKNEMSDFI